MSSQWTSTKHLPEITFIRIMLFIGVIASGLILLYAYNLGFWNDELFTWRVITLDGRSFIEYFLHASDRHPPLYYFFLKALLNLNPMAQHPLYYVHADFALKATGLIAYALLGGSLYIFGKKYPSTRYGVVLTFLIVSSSAYFLYLFAEIRMYGMIALFASTILLLGSRLTPKSSRFYHLLLGAVLAASLMTHYIALFFCAAFVIAYVLNTAFITRALREITRSVVLLLLFPAVVFIPYLPIFTRHLNKEVAYFRDLNDFVVYLGAMLNSYLVLIVGIMLVIWFLWLWFKHDTHMINSEDISLQLYRLVGLTFIVYLSLTVAYFFVSGNSIITFSTSVIFIVLFAYLFGFALQHLSLSVRIGFAMITLVFALAPNLLAITNSTYFESHRISYRDIIQHTELDLYVYDLGVQTIVTDAKDTAYTYYLMPLLQNQYPVEIVRVPDTEVLNPTYFDFEDRLQTVDCQGVLLLSRHWVESAPDQIDLEGVDYKAVAVTQGMTYVYPLERCGDASG